MKLPFARKKTTEQEVPTEIKQYYTEEARDQRSATWLTGALVFIVTVLVVLGLFYGGRALYRAITNDEAGDTPATEQTTEQTNDSSTDTTNTSQEQGQPVSPSTDDTPESTSDDSQPTDTPATTPQTGPSEPEEIPRTGPELDL